MGKLEEIGQSIKEGLRDNFGDQTEARLKDIEARLEALERRQNFSSFYKPSEKPSYDSHQLEVRKHISNFSGTPEEARVWLASRGIRL